jgi:hypothetical protein
VQLHNPLLHRYWFQTAIGFGFGVTAFSVEDAEHLLVHTVPGSYHDADVLNIIEDVDIRSLDQNQVVPNMGPPNLRGVWFPLLNLW